VGLLNIYDIMSVMVISGAGADVGWGGKCPVTGQRIPGRGNDADSGGTGLYSKTAAAACRARLHTVPRL